MEPFPGIEMVPLLLWAGRCTFILRVVWISKGETEHTLMRACHQDENKVSIVKRMGFMRDSLFGPVCFEKATLLGYDEL